MANDQHTELIWDGKFQEKVKLSPKRPVDKISLPFQTIEVIDEPRKEKEEALHLFGAGTRGGGWRNKLIWGENKLVMASLLEEFAGKINLIYIDPPFATGADFSFKTKVGDQEVTKEASILEEKAYRDTWGGGMDSYLQMMRERLQLMRELLADDGSIYVHLDWRVGHYVKLILDEIFGEQNLRREIIWTLKGASGYKSLVNSFVRGHDTILYYSKSENVTFNKEYLPYSEEQLRRFTKTDKHGKKFKPITKTRRIYLDEAKGVPITDVWTDIASFQTVVNAPERTNYPTQKPEKLLERIIKASTNEGDVVLDCFAGSGTTGAVAEKLGRRWIMGDLGRFAIHTSRKRLMGVQRELKEKGKPYYPFEILNLGKYERQYWQDAVINSGKKTPQAKKITEYIRFVVELYKGEAIQGFKHLHGKKDNRMIHIGAVDAPVTMREIQEAVDECKENNFTNLDVLGWEWEMGVNEEAIKKAKEQGIRLKLLIIPREVMEKRAVESGEVKFFELNFVAVDAKKKGKEARVKIKKFAIESDELIPEDLRAKVKNWADYIDYWAVDWDYESRKDKKGNPIFENDWQTFRTRKDSKLELETPWHTYDKKGRYTILVKVVDIFGNDTSKVVEVKI